MFILYGFSAYFRYVVLAHLLKVIWWPLVVYMHVFWTLVYSCIICNLTTSHLFYIVIFTTNYKFSPCWYFLTLRSYENHVNLNVSDTWPTHRQNQLNIYIPLLIVTIKTKKVLSFQLSCRTLSFRQLPLDRKLDYRLKIEKSKHHNDTTNYLNSLTVC